MALRKYCSNDSVATSNRYFFIRLLNPEDEHPLPHPSINASDGDIGGKSGSAEFFGLTGTLLVNYYE